MGDFYNGIQKIKEVIDYIEANLTEDLDCKIMAAKMNLSVYEFRRIFSFIVGCPLSEYIRKRRLSLAACEIATSENVQLIEISRKYGYSSQSAFTKAFCEQHGVSPSKYFQEKCEIALFTCPEFEFSIGGREDVRLKLIKDEAFFVKGFTGVSNITDTCCCENVWNEFYESGADETLDGDKLYVVYKNRDDSVECIIGERVEQDRDLSALKIPASRWVCFTLDTVEDDIINEV